MSIQLPLGQTHKPGSPEETSTHVNFLKPKGDSHTLQAGNDCSSISKRFHEIWSYTNEIGDYQLQRIQGFRRGAWVAGKKNHLVETGTGPESP